jgi:hypothetical protein
MTRMPTGDNVRPLLPLEPVRGPDFWLGIRKAILEGDIDKALKYTSLYYPHVLQQNEQVYFRLRCRKFVEMVRRSADLSRDRKRNGHPAEDIPGGPSSKMDLDDNGFDDEMETEDELGGGTPENQDSILLATIQYGKELQEEFKNDPRREVSKALRDVFSLLAYQDPFQAKEVAHLLDRKDRVAVAEELNSAILSEYHRLQDPILGLTGSLTQDIQCLWASHPDQRWRTCTARLGSCWITSGRRAVRVPL